MYYDILAISNAQIHNLNYFLLNIYQCSKFFARSMSGLIVNLFANDVPK